MSVSSTKERSTATGGLRRAYETAVKALLAEQLPQAYWAGELSSSALATATAVSALSLASGERSRSLIEAGLRWLQGDQNSDGGWGDSPTSPSNLPTTMLVQAAFALAGGRGLSVDVGSLDRAEAYVRRRAGSTAEERVRTLRALYGKDRTFATPILTNCALASQYGAGASGGIDWAHVPALPFELACVPRSLFKFLRLHVVSYALPALIAIGQVIHTRRPTWNPLHRLIRRLAVGPSLRRLEAIQPGSGGYLEAVPLTGFVTMSLAAMGLAGHSVARKGVEFLTERARADGSWPIDSNLSIWVTTQAVAALAAADELGAIDRSAIKQWLLDGQYTTVHPYTGSAPGGWGWTHLPGGVPDTDDTAGALLALVHVGGDDTTPAAGAGLRWLLGLQNADGGWPTFCRGWGRLPFDRSAPDLTAHAIRALAAWAGRTGVPGAERAVTRGLKYLRRSQRADGAWLPLWFGNQSAPGQGNPVYGTARVLLAYRDVGRGGSAEAQAGVRYLLRAQNEDGGWGGAESVAGSIEETALAVEALSGWPDEVEAREACLCGCTYLARRVAEGGLGVPASIGLYFAGLWYGERLYPIIWTVGALGSVLAGVKSAAAGASRQVSERR